MTNGSFFIHSQTSYDIGWIWSGKKSSSGLENSFCLLCLFPLSVNWRYFLFCILFLKIVDYFHFNPITINHVGYVLSMNVFYKPRNIIFPTLSSHRSLMTSLHLRISHPLQQLRFWFLVSKFLLLRHEIE